jgi:hypothetical protein
MPQNTVPPWLVDAASYIGFHEIGNNQGIEHFISLARTGQLGDPWCAIFANACLEARAGSSISEAPGPHCVTEDEAAHVSRRC